MYGIGQINAKCSILGISFDLYVAQQTEPRANRRLFFLHRQAGCDGGALFFPQDEVR